jgi:hypothetical protein
MNRWAWVCGVLWSWWWDLGIFVFWAWVFELSWYGARGLIVMGFDMLSWIWSWRCGACGVCVLVGFRDLLL